MTLRNTQAGKGQCDGAAFVRVEGREGLAQSGRLEGWGDLACHRQHGPCVRREAEEKALSDSSS